MNRWLAILLPLSLLGQAPRPGTEPVSRLPETDELDPATRELRDAVEAERDEADTFATPGVTPPLLPEDTGGWGPEVSDTNTGVGGSGTPAATAPTTAARGTQTPAAVDAPPAPADLPPTPEQMARQLQQLQTQVRSLQEQLQTREQQLTQNTERTEGLQQDMATLQSRSAELELLRQQRLAQLQSAWQWMLAADNALAVGELGVDEALRQADLALSDALENAASIGKGETVLLMRDARGLLASARTSVDNRDVYNARVALQTAGQNLSQARALSLSQPDVSLAAPPATESDSAAGR